MVLALVLDNFTISLQMNNACKTAVPIKSRVKEWLEHRLQVYACSCGAASESGRISGIAGNRRMGNSNRNSELSPMKAFGLYKSLSDLMIV